MPFERMSWLWIAPLLLAATAVALLAPTDDEGQVMSGVALAPPPQAADPQAPPPTPPELRRPVRALIDRVPAQPAPPPDGPDWRPRVPRAAPSALTKAWGWLASVRAFCGLPAVDGDAALQRIAALFGDVDEPVVRQNLIFLVALGVPWDAARPWLEDLAFGTEAGPWNDADREDALVALAFAGIPQAVSAFISLAETRAPAHVHRLVDHIDDHEAIGVAGGSDARRTLRSYRAIEVLDRAPYFKILAYRAPLGWHETGAPSIDGRTALSLETAWLGRYPGHPGSDDIALRVARRHLVAGDATSAAHWFGRAATLPDQDVTHGAVAGLLSVAELLLTPEETEQVAFAEGDETPNHELLAYVHVRRVAAEQGFDAAVDAMDALAASGSAETLTWAWRRRWLAHVPHGLTSGLQPLDAADPLRTRVRPWTEDAPDPGPEAAEPQPPVPARSWEERRALRRLEPDREARSLDTDRLERQFRIWETLAELERRADAARGGDERADLRYKQAAVLYHNRDALFPVYGGHTYGFRSLLSGTGWEGHPEAETATKGRLRLEQTSYHLLRAIDVLHRIEREHPRYAGMDKVLFSRAMAWKKLAEYRPWTSWHSGVMDPDTRAGLAIRAAVEGFEAVATDFAESPLADDAARAARHWRSRLGRTR